MKAMEPQKSLKALIDRMDGLHEDAEMEMAETVDIGVEELGEVVTTLRVVLTYLREAQK